MSKSQASPNVRADRRTLLTDRLAAGFGPTFGLTYFVTALTFAFFTFEEADRTAFALVLSFLGGLFVGISNLLEAAIAAALIFFPTFMLLGRFIYPPMVFLAVAPMTAYASAYLSMSVNLDLFPPNLEWLPRQEELARYVAGFATRIATVIAIAVMAIQTLPVLFND